MKELLKSGVVGKIELNAQKKIREDIQKRWEGLGLVNGLDGHLKETVATLYENEAKHLMTEANAADNSGSFETVVFPMVRRVFSRLLANDIVSVQALNLPVGKLFYFRPVTSERTWDYEDMFRDGNTGSHKGLMGYKRTNRFYDPNYNDGKGEITGREREKYNRYYLPDEVVDPVQVSTTETDPEVTQYMKKSLYDLFYDDFLFDNSKGKATIKVGVANAMYMNEQGEYKEVTNVDQLKVYTLMDGTTPVDVVDSIILQLSGFSSFNAGRLTGPDGNEMDTEAFLASLKVQARTAITSSNKNCTSIAAGEILSFRVMTQQYGKGIVGYDNLCDAEGKMYIEVDLTKPAMGTIKTVNGYIGVEKDALAAIITTGTGSAETGFNVAWCQYDSLELETEMGEVGFQLTPITVSVEERKLRATWSPELAQDVSAFHNIDAEAEMTNIMAEQVSGEIDREILRDLRKAAPWQVRWDYSGWQRLQTTSTVYTQKDWNQTLMTKINIISAQIQKATLKGGANFIVVSSEIGAVLNDLEYFHVTDATAGNDTYNMGIEKIGSLQGRYQVYVDPYSPYYSMIIGHHGDSLLDTGYIYAPYIPLALTPVMTNPFNMAPVRGICTRYAKKLVNNRYYGAIRVDNLTHWDTKELR